MLGVVDTIFIDPMVVYGEQWALSVGMALGTPCTQLEGLDTSSP
jgi:hypothetical protein